MAIKPFDVNSLISKAATDKVSTDLQPLLERVSRVRSLLDVYETLARQEAERRVSNTLLTALAQPVLPEITSLPGTKKRFYEALMDLASAVDGPFDVAAGHAPTGIASAAEPCPLTLVYNRDNVASLPGRRVLPDDFKTHAKLYAELDQIARNIKGQHPLRTGPLLQAIAAEVRVIMDRLPVGHSLHDKFSQLIPYVGKLRKDAGIEDYIRGLMHGASEDWVKIAQIHRHKVEVFDRDATQGMPVERSTSRTRGDDPSEKTTRTHEWPELPSLRKLQRAIVLVGGLIVPEKIELVRERFGLEVMWFVSDGTRTDDVVVERIKSGTIGAVVVLEGLVGHNTSGKVIEACKTNNVPCTYGDKGGTGSLGNAFHDLDRRLTG